MPPSSPSSRSRPWWRGALEEFSDIGRRWLKARYPSLRHMHDDLLGATLLQVTHLLADRDEQWPSAWFAFDPPPAEDVKRFHGLAFTVLVRRVQDEFRSDVASWLESLEELPEDQHPASTAPDAATALGQKRAIRALIAVMREMSQRDQALIERVAMGDKSQPMSGAERERVRQLRRRLRVQLHHVLGDDDRDAARILLNKSSGGNTGDGSES